MSAPAITNSDKFSSALSSSNLGLRPLQANATRASLLKCQQRSLGKEKDNEIEMKEKKEENQK